MLNKLGKFVFVLTLCALSIPAEIIAAQSSGGFIKVKSHLVDYPYLISIKSTSKSVRKKIFEKIDFMKDFYIYELPVQVDGQDEIYVRIGFFSSRILAEQTLAKLESSKNRPFQTEIIQVPERELRYLSSWVNRKQAQAEVDGDVINNTRLLAMMEEARQAMVKNDYRLAISHYSKVVSYESTDFFQAALEYLGLARERNKQFAHAKAEYERYLRLYPEGEGAERVRQRLIGLLSASMPPKKKLRESKRNSLTTDWQTFGSFSQYYRRDTLFDDSLNDDAVISGAYSSFFYSAKLKTRSYEIKNQISMSHNYDFEENDPDNKLLKIATMYSEANFQSLKMSSRIGRQIQNTSGAFGRFDGAVLSYQYKPNVYLRAISGYPVEFDTYDRIQTEKRFYSANLEIESAWNLFDFNTYFITQYADKLLDRQALGMDVRHFSNKTTLFSNLDYDIHYQVVNNFVLNASYQLFEGNTVGVFLTHRHSPLLTTSSALQGQTVSSLKELQQRFSDEEIAKLAEDRTAKYNSATLTWSQQLKKNIQLNHDYTISELSSTTASADVEASEGTGLEHYISSQIMATSWLKPNDVTILGLRLARLSTSDRITLNFLRRDIYSAKMRFSSKLRLDYQARDDDSVIYVLKPSLNTNYRMSKMYRLEAEIGVEHRIREKSLDPGSESNVFFSLGYLAQF